MRLDAVQVQVHQRQPPRPGDEFLPEVGLRLDPLGDVAVQRALGLRDQPLVGGDEEAAGAAGRVADREVAAARAGRASCSGRWTGSAARGVKYCPAPFLPSLAAFSSSPSNAAAFTSTSSAVHSVSSIRLTSFLRLTGLLKRDCAPAKMSPRMPGCLPSVRRTSM